MLQGDHRSSFRGQGLDLADLREQLTQMQQLGGMSGLMSMMPGMAKIKNQLAERNLDEKVLKRQMAIIDSMTRQERLRSGIIDGSRRRRIAAGAGVQVQDVNRLLKQFMEMQKLMKGMKGGKLGRLIAGMRGATPPNLPRGRPG